MSHSVLATFAFFLSLITSGPGLTAEPSAAPAAAGVDWPAFMARQDMHFTKPPRNWTQAPHFGNASVGSMLFLAGPAIRLQVFRADVQDHRDDSYGWAAYA